MCRKPRRTHNHTERTCRLLYPVSIHFPHYFIDLVIKSDTCDSIFPEGRLIVVLVPFIESYESALYISGLLLHHNWDYYFESQVSRSDEVPKQALLFEMASKFNCWWTSHDRPWPIMSSERGSPSGSLQQHVHSNKSLASPFLSTRHCFGPVPGNSGVTVRWWWIWTHPSSGQRLSGGKKCIV